MATGGGVLGVLYVAVFALASVLAALIITAGVGLAGTVAGWRLRRARWSAGYCAAIGLGAAGRATAWTSPRSRYR